MVSKRLGKFIEFKQMSFYAFENSINASRGSISKAVKEEKSVGSNVLENILTVYPELNPIWLLKGTGEMTSKNKQITNVSDFDDIDIIEHIFSNIETFKHYNSFKSLVKSLYADGELLEVKREIKELKEKIEKLNLNNKF